MRMIALVAALLLVAALAPARAAPAGVFSSSPFGIKVRENRADRPLISEFPKLGARATYISVFWDTVEPAQGQWRWQGLDRWIDDANGAGVEMYLKLLTGTSWATQGSAGGGDDDTESGKASLMPRRLGDYETFVAQVVEHTKGRVRRFAIQNEVNAETQWPGSLDDYLALLDAAYRTIRRVNPEAIVATCGMGTRVYGAAIARDWLDRGRAAEALAFYNRYYQYRVDPVFRRAPTVEALRAILDGPRGARAVAYAVGQFRSRSYDVYQLHFYEPWDLLPTVVGWIREKMKATGYERPIEAWEIGYHRTPDAYDARGHARDVVKLLATALGLDVRRMIYLPFTTERVQRGGRSQSWPLYGGDRQPTQAGQAFALVATRLGTATGAARVNAGQGVTAYRFTTAGGPVYVMWADRPAQATLDVPFAQARATDALGAARTAQASGGRITLSVDETPLVIDAAR